MNTELVLRSMVVLASGLPETGRLLSQKVPFSDSLLGSGFPFV